MAVFSLTVFGGCDFFDFFKKPNEEDEVTISQDYAEISVGETVELTAISSENREIIWTSSDDAVASVDDYGLVTGLSEGETEITANDGKKFAVCEVTVTPAKDDGDKEQKPDKPEQPKVTVTISQSKAEIFEAGSLELKATASDGTAVGWYSSNTSIATVSQFGVVRGVKAGVATITAATNGNASATCEVTVLKTSDRKLVWSDEFNGTALDTKVWSYQTGTQDHYGNSWGPQYWGNDELQYYTNGNNVKVADGVLEITAKRESMGDRDFTSARITTRDTKTYTYGYFEARIKSPAIEGMWPAFWMLPQPSSKNSTDNAYGGWPNNGEIDIMEAKGRLKNVVDCTLHYGRGWENENHMMNGKSPTLSSNIDQWHTYALDWRKDYIAWIVDGREVHRVTSSEWWTGSSTVQTAPFDKPFYILLNLAVGGQYDNYRSPSASFSQATMSIDYVRVYE